MNNSNKFSDNNAAAMKFIIFEDQWLNKSLHPYNLTEQSSPLEKPTHSPYPHHPSLFGYPFPSLTLYALIILLWNYTWESLCSRW